MKKQMKKPTLPPKNRKIKKKPQDQPKILENKSKSNEIQDSRKQRLQSREQKKTLKDIKVNTVDQKKGRQTRSKAKTSVVQEKRQAGSKDDIKIEKKKEKKSKSKSKGKIVQEKKTNSRDEIKISKNEQILTSKSSQKLQPILAMYEGSQRSFQFNSLIQSPPSSPKKLIQRYRTKSIAQQLQNYKCQFNPLLKKYTITLHDNYSIDQTHKLYSNIQNLFKLFIQKQKKKSQSIFVKTRYSFYPAFQFSLDSQHSGQHKCCICQFQFQQPSTIQQMQQLLLSVNDSDIVQLKCSHLLHLQCLKMLIGDKQWFKCPVCSMIYGKMIGDQPQGKMTSSVNQWMRCDGYGDVGTIVVHYSMKGGKRGDVEYPPTGRTAYLPNNVQGNEVLSLLKQAFERKLIFTVGRSVTTGRDNQIVWNGIHHKTSLTGGSAYFGYPDPTYFDRVKLELAAKGIF